MVAQHYQVSRKKQDEYAYMSHTRASKVGFTIRIVRIHTKPGLLARLRQMAYSQKRSYLLRPMDL